MQQSEKKSNDEHSRIRSAEELLDDYYLMAAEAKASASWFQDAAAQLRNRLNADEPMDRSLRRPTAVIPETIIRQNQPDIEAFSKDREVAAFALLRYYLQQHAHAEQEAITVEHYIRDVQRRLAAMMKEDVR